MSKTLLIGLGGIGSKITDHIYGKLQNETCNVNAFCIDTDIYTFSTLENISEESAIRISAPVTLSSMLAAHPEAKEWFPKDAFFANQTLCNGAGQVREASRLAFCTALRHRKFHPLIDCVNEIAKSCAAENDSMRIVIITSLVGGTGSGMFLQLAMLLRKVAEENWSNVDIQIQGEFICSEVFASLCSPSELKRFKDNALAASVELNMVNNQILHNGTSAGFEKDLGWESFDLHRIPYNCIFTYDSNYENDFHHALKHIETVILNRYQ